jgi:hypothetical protein
MRTLFAENSFDEKTEVAIHRVATAFVDAMGPQALIDMNLPYVAKHEERLRQKYPADENMLVQLDEYREQVRLGLREPLPGVK